MKKVVLVDEILRITADDYDIQNHRSFIFLTKVEQYQFWLKFCVWGQTKSETTLMWSIKKALYRYD